MAWYEAEKRDSECRKPPCGRLRYGCDESGNLRRSSAGSCLRNRRPSGNESRKSGDSGRQRTRGWWQSWCRRYSWRRGRKRARRLQLKRRSPVGRRPGNDRRRSNGRDFGRERSVWREKASDASLRCPICQHVPASATHHARLSVLADDENRLALGDRHPLVGPPHGSVLFEADVPRDSNAQLRRMRARSLQV